MPTDLDQAEPDAASFRVHAVPISAYRVDVPTPFPPVDADTEAHGIADLMAPYGGLATVVGTPVQGRDATWVKDRLNEWASRDAPGSSVLMWVGHGESDGDRAWLASYRSEQGKKGTGHSPAELAEFITDEWATRQNDSGAWTLVLLEACGSQRFADLLAAQVSATPNAPLRVAFAYSGGEGTAFLGRFRRALGDTLAGFTDNDDTIGIRDLLGRLDERLDKVGGGMITRHLGGARPITRPREFTTGITAPQDVYLELRRFVATLPDDVRGHFLPKAQGAEQGELAWYFVGRDDERRQITTWLRHAESGLLVVTGPAGSGKSALLGNLLVHTTPDLRDLLVQAGQITHLPDDQQPPDGVFDTVLTMTGMTILDVVARLLVAAGLDPQPANWSPAERVEGLLDGLRRRSEPFTVLLDALDEAQDPLAVAATLVRRVAGAPGCRVVLGTRRSTHEGPDLPDPPDSNILDALAGHTTLTTITVGIDPKATTEYVRLRLTAARPTMPGMANATDTAIKRVAGLIGSRQRPFLYARLAVHEIIAHPGLLTADTDALEKLLAKDHRALFAHALHRLDQKDPTHLPLLEALAYAQGRGLPRADRIWTTVANALTDTVEITDIDIDRVLAAAAPYIMLDAEAGQSVYRLAHRTYQEHFLTPDVRP